MHLRIGYDAACPVDKQIAGNECSLFQGVRHLALWHGNAVFRKNFFRLILVNLQFWCPSHRKPEAHAWMSDSVWCPAVLLASPASPLPSKEGKPRYQNAGRAGRTGLTESVREYAANARNYDGKHMASLKELLKPLAEDGSALTREQSAGVLEEILAGGVPEVETAALLSVLATRGEQAPELAGFVETMRAHATPLPLTDEERNELVDTCGTGGGGPLTFNISTGAALVAAAAGAKVAKHGNRAVTSLAGSADVLEALGVPVTLGPELAVECLRETGFMFLFAPLYHPAMKVVGPLRKALGFRTIFNLCGPLTNPAGARAQVIGVLAPSRVLLMARTLAALGAKRAFVVHGTDGIDELTTTGESVVARVEEPVDGGTPALK